MTLQIDFMRDGAALLGRYLTGLGYDISALTQEEVRIGYFNVKHRSISKRQRKINYAEGFCCPPEMQAGLAYVERKICNGDDLRPHLSRGLLKTHYSDLLLNDWGVYHLHLGTTVESDGFAKRTGPVLFAKFTETDAYLIDVITHGAWSDQNIIRTLHSNWPEIIEKFKLVGVRPIWPGGSPPTDAEILMFRRAGVVVIQELGGAAYVPVGGGYATDGTSIDVVKNSDAFARQLVKCEQEVKALEPTLRGHMQIAGMNLPDPLPVQLEERFDGMILAIFGNAIASVEIGHLNH